MIRRTFILAEAQIDIRETTAWYEIQEAGMGNSFLSEVLRSLKLIAQTPRQFPTVGDEVRRSLVRRFPYSIYFFLRRDTVVVIAVLHQHRDPQTWKNRG